MSALALTSLSLSLSLSTDWCVSDLMSVSMVCVNRSWFAGRHPEHMKKGKASFVEDLFAIPNLRSDHVMMTESYIDHERAKVLSGDYKSAWAPPPIEVTRVCASSLSLMKPLKDLYPVDVWHKYAYVN